MHAVTLNATGAAANASCAAANAPSSRSLMLLSGAFALFNGLRIVAYLPTLWAIQHSTGADQHSLFTWLTFLGANATMALWLHAHNGRRVNRAVAVNAFNALMCGAIAASIIWLRWTSQTAASFLNF